MGDKKPSTSCEHDHHDSPEIGIHYTLHTKIDLENVQCLNERIDNSGKDVFKPWERRLDFEKFVESDADEELLFNIPFTGNVKLKGIVVIGGEGESHPSKMKLFKNRPYMPFDATASEADQEFDMQPDSTGVIEYNTKVVKFSSVQHLSIFFPKNFGADATKVYYIGLKGEFTEAKRQEITICSYEMTPNPADHKIDNLYKVNQSIS